MINLLKVSLGARNFSSIAGTQKNANQGRKSERTSSSETTR